MFTLLSVTEDMCSCITSLTGLGVMLTLFFVANDNGILIILLYLFLELASFMLIL